MDYVAVLADMYSPLVGRALDPMKEIVTFNGAQEGIASILASLVEPVGTRALLYSYPGRPPTDIRPPCCPGRRGDRVRAVL